MSLALLALALLADPPQEAPGATLFHGGDIYVAAEGPVVEALLVRDGRVLAAGPEARLRSRLGGHGVSTESLRTVDLGGAVAVPGLADGHGHLEGYGDFLESVDLRGVTSFGELIRRVAAQAERQPPGTWIQGRGWDQNLWAGKSMPHHDDLSTAVPEHPVFLTRVDGHAALVNARALRRAGLVGEIRDPLRVQGGEILLDAQGEASGVLVDTAMGIVTRRIPGPTLEDRKRRLVLAQDALLAEGIVCVHDMGLSPSTVTILQDLIERDRFQLRVIAYLRGNALLPQDVLEAYPADLAGGDQLRVVGVKLMIDGALGSRGADLLEDYADREGHTGLSRYSKETLQELVEAYAAAGLQPATHAIGDRGNRLVLDAFEDAMIRVPGLRDLRPRIEHAQIVHRDDWARFSILGVIPSVQPTHCTSDMRWVPDRIGFDRVPGAYAWRRLAPDVDVLAFGSDFPVERPNPLAGLYAARTRSDAAGLPEGGFLADQRMSGTEALHGFTEGCAYAAHEETSRGKLAVGYAADMTVLDFDPVRCDPAELLDGRVLMTVIDGQVVFEAEGR